MYPSFKTFPGQSKFEKLGYFLTYILFGLSTTLITWGLKFYLGFQNRARKSRKGNHIAGSLFLVLEISARKNVTFLWLNKTDFGHSKAYEKQFLIVNTLRTVYLI